MLERKKKLLSIPCSYNTYSEAFGPAPPQTVSNINTLMTAYFAKSTVKVQIIQSKRLKMGEVTDMMVEMLRKCSLEVARDASKIALECSAWQLTTVNRAIDRSRNLSYRWTTTFRGLKKLWFIYPGINWLNFYWSKNETQLILVKWFLMSRSSQRFFLVSRRAFWLNWQRWMRNKTVSFSFVSETIQSF